MESERQETRDQEIKTQRGVVVAGMDEYFAKQSHFVKFVKPQGVRRRTLLPRKSGHIRRLARSAPTV